MQTDRCRPVIQSFTRGGKGKTKNPKKPFRWPGEREQWGSLKIWVFLETHRPPRKLSSQFSPFSLPSVVFSCWQGLSPSCLLSATRKDGFGGVEGVNGEGEVVEMEWTDCMAWLLVVEILATMLNQR